MVAAKQAVNPAGEKPVNSRSNANRPAKVLPIVNAR
jgi:hypothetical protein